MFCFSDWTHFPHGIRLAFWKKSFPHPFIKHCWPSIFFSGCLCVICSPCIFLPLGTVRPHSFWSQGTPSTEPSTTQEIGSHSGPHIAWHFDSLNLPPPTLKLTALKPLTMRISSAPKGSRIICQPLVLSTNFSVPNLLFVSGRVTPCKLKRMMPGPFHKWVYGVGN